MTKLAQHFVQAILSIAEIRSELGQWLGMSCGMEGIRLTPKWLVEDKNYLVRLLGERSVGDMNAGQWWSFCQIWIGPMFLDICKSPISWLIRCHPPVQYVPDQYQQNLVDWNRGKMWVSSIPGRETFSKLCRTALVLDVFVCWMEKEWSCLGPF